MCECVSILLLICITGIKPGLVSSRISPDSCTYKHDDKDTWTCNYIPEDIPEHVTKVRIVDFLSVNRSLEINVTYFQTKNWGQITSLELSDSISISRHLLTFANRCFISLRQLQELRIHILASFSFNSNAFKRIDNLIHLDITDCRRLKLEPLLYALDGANKLSRLQKLTISGISKYRSQIAMNEYFAKVLGQKRIEAIDVSDTQVALVNATALKKYMKTLKFVNMSFSIIADVYHFGIHINDVLKLYVLDLSNVVFPKKIWSFPQVNTVVTGTFKGESNYAGMLFAPKILNISGIVPGSLSFVNCTLVLNQTFHVEELVVQDSNIKVLDIQVLASASIFPQIKVVDISNNGIKFIHPSILANVPNVRIVDVSYNELSNMLIANTFLFGKLLKDLQHLNSISLSSNNLNTVPKYMFQTNLEIVKIDLSKNKLSQVTFDLEHLDNLKVLDLRYNLIQILNDPSIKKLKSIANANGSVLLDYNPISCSKCNAKSSVQWILTSKPVENIHLPLNMTCINERGHWQYINNLAVKDIQAICFRKVIVMLITASSIILILFIIMFVSCGYKTYKKKQCTEKRKKAIRCLQEGEGPNEFAVYLTYNSDEEQKVLEVIGNGLNTELKSEINVNRDLVLPTANDHPRSNQSIFYICKHYLEKSSLVIMVLLEECVIDEMHEFQLQQAVCYKRPIIIISKENIDLKTATCELYQNLSKCKRINYHVENKTNTLQYSWREICRFIIDLINIDENKTEKQNCFNNEGGNEPQNRDEQQTEQQNCSINEGYDELPTDDEGLDLITLLP